MTARQKKPAAKSAAQAPAGAAQAPTEKAQGAMASAGKDTKSRSPAKAPPTAKPTGTKPTGKTTGKTAETKAEIKAETKKGSFGARKWHAEELRGLYEQMLLIRRFEEKAGQLYGLGLIGGFCHLYIGQEAVVVGAVAARRFKTSAGTGKGKVKEKVKEKVKGTGGDTLTTSYRAHGHALAVGGSPHKIMAELLGRASGCCGGKGGSMHLFDTAAGFFGGHGIVAAQVPIAAGVGFAEKYLGGDGVAMVFFGDGALNQGQVYETFNMAALWRLPVLFVIENNRYGMGTSIERAAAHSENLAARGAAYGIDGKKIDGMDVLAVHDGVAEALEQIRGAGGPRILEAVTYRYRGHSMSDPAKYRSREEVEEVRARQDPIDRLAKRLEESGVLDETARKEIDARVREEVKSATEAAEKDSEPDERELWTDVYAANGAHAIVVAASGMTIGSAT